MNAFKVFPPVALCFLTAVAASAQDYNHPRPPSISSSTLSNAQRQVQFTPYPAGDQFKMLRKNDLGSNTWLEDTSGVFSGPNWTTAHNQSNAFYRLQVNPLSSNVLLAATVLSKLTYGPTPDLLDRLAVIGPEAYINEQLNPETITERVALTHTNNDFLSAKFGTPTTVLSATATTGPGTAVIADLRAWYALHAVGADRQLYEILTQFIDNHFTTQYAKDTTFVNGLQFPGSVVQRFGADVEWRELARWRQALLSPTNTFLDLLTISAESPAMLIYLDTVANRANIPNENYSRELLELFTMGVDNGYDQSDITNMAPCWTGWTLEMVPSNQASNVFAAKTTAYLDPNASNRNAYTNLVGVWALNFKANNHATYAKTIFGGKTVPARFGLPYTTKTYGGIGTAGLYQLNIPARTGNNGMQDGYDIVRHLSMLPFTQEYISVKLCRVFVHDDFATGYNFTDPNLSEEGQLVKACMAAWEAHGGQLRPILATIFNSALFRSHGGNAHKVKTPFEFSVSAIRALRSSTNGSGQMGSFTASTDGYGLVQSSGRQALQGTASPMGRMGGMILFNRTDPDGYAETGPAWVNAGSLAERIRYVQSLLMASGVNSKNDDNAFLKNNLTDPVTLLRSRLTAAPDQKDAGKVADLFLGFLFPGEGKASLDEYRTVAMNYLNTSDDGLSSSPFNQLSVSNVANSTYDTRVRGMVAMLLSLQRFNEQ